jgi:membrane peptidoglycan carboxypeptidase
MVVAVLGRMSYSRGWKRRRRQRRFQFFLRFVAVLRWAAVLGVVLLLAWGAAAEMRTSLLQSRLFTQFAREMNFAVGPGPSDTVRFPAAGPYDERLGYAELPGFIAALRNDDFVVDRQARWSPTLTKFVDYGGYAIYREKTRAGLELFGRNDVPLYRARYPQRAYRDFRSIPPLVVDSLLFSEDHALLDPTEPRLDPAVDWERFMLAAGGRLAGLVNPHWRRGGASTLATQTEKFLHSPAGRTPDAWEKLRQMVSAALRAYRDGPDTLPARRRIIVAYLDCEPLASRPGYGEILGVPEALWLWYGTDLAEANRVLAAPAADPAQRARKGTIYRQVLSLLLAGRRPYYYLVENRVALDRLTDRYLHLLYAAGVVEPALYHATIAARLTFRTKLPPPPTIAYVGGKATDRLRDHLVSLLHLPDLYALDRLDVTGHASVDTAVQDQVSDVLSHLDDPVYDRSLGLYGKQLLGGASPSRLAWSVVLYERGADRNYLRVHADSLNAPFDINSGAKLQLGSTAKLRTLVTYLDIVDALHRRLADEPRAALSTTEAAAAKDDPITAWAAGYLANAKDKSLQPMLDAAMQRSYSASPGTYFTGGGWQSFANFEKWEDHERPTVAAAFANSINNAFVRLMRDIVSYEIARSGTQISALLHDRDDPRRMAYLHRFADQEGRRYLDRFWRDLHGMTPQQMLVLLAHRTRPDPRRLAALFRTLQPTADRAALGAFLADVLPHETIDDARLWDLYRETSPRAVSLRDRSYIAGIHPLELWLVGYLQQHPDATRAEMLAAGADARQQAYAWLFEKRSPYQQNLRIRILLEQQAFDRILLDWRRQGYPFAQLVPSDGTAIGSSGDRPDALAKLVGIVVNDGVRRPTVDLQQLNFAAGTPYETDMSVGRDGERVLAPEVAATVRRAMLAVVAGGTGTRVRGAFRAAAGTPIAVGGKTGTGDNRYDTFGAGGRLIGQRVVDRTATFVFFLGDRFFGTVTAYVPGAVAIRYDFTSALAVQLLKAIEPQLRPLFGPPAVAKPAPAAPSPSVVAAVAPPMPASPQPPHPARLMREEASAAERLNTQELKRLRAQ